MREADSFDCDNPECLWSKYELMVTKSAIDNDGFQKKIEISVLRCECEASILQRISQVQEHINHD